VAGLAQRQLSDASWFRLSEDRYRGKGVEDRQIVAVAQDLGWNDVSGK
jgi:hypothetical protein